MLFNVLSAIQTSSQRTQLPAEFFYFISRKSLHFFSFNFTPLNFILCLLYNVSILSTFPYLQKLLFLIRRGLWNDLFDAVRKTLSWDSQKPRENFYFTRISAYYIRSTSNVQTHIYSKYTLMLLLLYIS